MCFEPEDDVTRYYLMTGQSGVISAPENLTYSTMENRDFFWWEIFAFHPQLKTAGFGSSHESSVIKNVQTYQCIVLWSIKMP